MLQSTTRQDCHSGTMRHACMTTTDGPATGGTRRRPGGAKGCQVVATRSEHSTGYSIRLAYEGVSPWHWQHVAGAALVDPTEGRHGDLLAGRPHGAGEGSG